MFVITPDATDADVAAVKTCLGAGSPEAAPGTSTRLSRAGDARLSGRPAIPSVSSSAWA
jgi:hypothetical protein